jgi:hypothetical protein
MAREVMTKAMANEVRNGVSGTAASGTKKNGPFIVPGNRQASEITAKNTEAPESADRRRHQNAGSTGCEISSGQSVQGRRCCGKEVIELVLGGPLLF